MLKLRKLKHTTAVEAAAATATAYKAHTTSFNNVVFVEYFVENLDCIGIGGSSCCCCCCRLSGFYMCCCWCASVVTIHKALVTWWLENPISLSRFITFKIVCAHGGNHLFQRESVCVRVNVLKHTLTHSLLFNTLTLIHTFVVLFTRFRCAYGKATGCFSFFSVFNIGSFAVLTISLCACAAYFSAGERMNERVSERFSE